MTVEFFLTFMAFCLGASIASFLGVVVERGKRKEPITGRSHCACGRQLTWYENIPVIGWLSCAGMTRCCKQRLPVSYVLTEIGLGLVFAVPAYFLLVSFLRY